MISMDASLGSEQAERKGEIFTASDTTRLLIKWEEPRCVTKNIEYSFPNRML